MISPSEQSQIKGLMSSPQWSAIEHVKAELLEKIADETKTDTEWDTIQSALIAEGQRRGINRLFNELFQQATDVS